MADLVNEERFRNRTDCEIALYFTTVCLLLDFFSNNNHIILTLYFDLHINRFSLLFRTIIKMIITCQKYAHFDTSNPLISWNELRLTD